MKYSVENYKEMARRFNLLGTEGKLLLVKMNSTLFKLEFDGTWYALRLWDNDAQEQEIDMLFELDNLLEGRDLEGIKIHKVNK